MVIDVDENSFENEVVERSRSTPVVVDFWAEWCGPCRQLTPALEKATKARDGKVVLAKVDTDANPGLAREFGIQGIPAVKAFRDGKVVDEFVGAQPPPAVERFFDGLAPSAVDELVAKGDEASLREALTIEPARMDAKRALAQILHQRGDDDDALDLLESVAGDFSADGLAARIRLERGDDPVLREAFAALDEGKRKRALDLFIEQIAGAPGDGAREDLRRIVVGILDELGVDDPLAREYRRRLASALY